MLLDRAAGFAATPALRLGPAGDILVMRVIVRGVKNGASHTHTFDLVDYFDPETGYTAMAQTTGLPAAHAARKIADGTIRETGSPFSGAGVRGSVGRRAAPRARHPWNVNHAQ